jgi:hypothetical protein
MEVSHGSSRSRRNLTYVGVVICLAWVRPLAKDVGARVAIMGLLERENKAAT